MPSSRAIATDAPNAPLDAPPMRLALVACLVAMYASTWPLWCVRDAPPALALVALPVSFGAPLVACALAALVRPRAALVAHLAVSLVACAADLTRLQPALFSLPLLVAATLPSRDAATLARAQLTALWLAGALHKYFSPDYALTVAPWMGSSLPSVLSFLAPYAGSLVIALELSAGLASLVARARRVAAALGVALHLSIVALLVSQHHNRGVWAWNVALALAAAHLFWDAPAALPSLRALSRSGRVMLVALVVLPFTAPLGVPPALAGKLYAGGIARTFWCDARGDCITDREQRECARAFGVPPPMSRWALRMYFRRACAPGDAWQLFINDVRLDVLRCPTR